MGKNFRKAQAKAYKPAEDFQGKVLDLIYWRDPKRSGIALTSILTFVFLLAHYNWISLFAFLAMIVLTGTGGYRIYHLIQAQLKKTDATNPFKECLEKEVKIPEEKIHAHVDTAIEHVYQAILKFRSLFLVENLFESIKFGLMLYTLYYVGYWFSGYTLVFLFVLGLFITPKVYELNQEPIDKYIKIAQEHWQKFNQTINEKLPFLKQQQQTPAPIVEEKKEE